jgi:hypothetical protein
VTGIGGAATRLLIRTQAGDTADTIFSRLPAFARVAIGGPNQLDVVKDNNGAIVTARLRKVATPRDVKDMPVQYAYNLILSLCYSTLMSNSANDAKREEARTFIVGLMARVDLDGAKREDKAPLIADRILKAYQLFVAPVFAELSLKDVAAGDEAKLRAKLEAFNRDAFVQNLEKETSEPAKAGLIRIHTEDERNDIITFFKNFSINSSNEARNYLLSPLLYTPNQLAAANPAALGAVGFADPLAPSQPLTSERITSYAADIKLSSTSYEAAKRLPSVLRPFNTARSAHGATAQFSSLQKLMDADHTSRANAARPTMARTMRQDEDAEFAQTYTPQGGSRKRGVITRADVEKRHAGAVAHQQDPASLAAGTLQSLYPDLHELVSTPNFKANWEAVDKNTGIGLLAQWCAKCKCFSRFVFFLR